MVGTASSLLALLAVVAAAAPTPSRVSLDGNWTLLLLPVDSRRSPPNSENGTGGMSQTGDHHKHDDDVSEALFEKAMADGRSAVVPGAWDAQGFGVETDRLRSNWLGRGVYARAVTAPARASEADRVVFVVERPKRSVTAYVARSNANSAPMWSCRWPHLYRAD
jgi:hypothetical protein